jgi:hypothetical protein
MYHISAPRVACAKSLGISACSTHRARFWKNRAPEGKATGKERSVAKILWALDLRSQTLAFRTELERQSITTTFAR